MTPTTPAFFEAQLPALLSGRRDAPAFWMLGILWIPLLEAHQTGGLFSVTEQLMPKDSGAHTKHVHNVDERFYVLDGTVDFELEGETSSGQDGDSLWIPRGTVHSFNVTSDVCHVLNGYTPGGFEQVIKGLARPAPKRELPPRTEEPSPEDIAAAQFLFSNYWTARAEDPWAKSFAR
jgi:mannose-6-phosphate isomerase-like protein (cupin superfamily)